MDTAISEIEIGPVASVRKQIARQLRERILSGNLVEGSKLPSTEELSQKWQVARSSVQAAMASLVKEGLIERVRKRGTFVAHRSRTLTHVGVYLSENIWQMPHAAFRRSVISTLGVEMRSRGQELDVWIDSRPIAAQGEPWPDLVRAVEQRQVQALLLPEGEDITFGWISRLPVPWVALTSCPTRNRVYISWDAAGRISAETLSRQGCRSVGMIAPIASEVPAGGGGLLELAGGPISFRQTALSLGMEVRGEWMQHPSRLIPEADAEQFGYEAMKRLLALERRPEGIFVTHDVVARGALMAVLESKVSVPDDLKLILHRNVEIGLLCPVRASFLDFSVASAVQAMIGMMDGQLRGEEAEPVAVVPRICDGLLSMP